jgi:transcriptional regulator
VRKHALANQLAFFVALSIQAKTTINRLIKRLYNESDKLDVGSGFANCQLIKGSLPDGFEHSGTAAVTLDHFSLLQMSAYFSLSPLQHNR